MAGIAAAILGAGALSAGAAIYGASRQTQAANRAIQAQQGMFNQAVGFAQPFIGAGQAAIPTLQRLVTPGPDQTATLMQTPGFQFANQMAQMGVTNQATATGLGGNALLAGGNAASQLALGMAWQPTINALQSIFGTGAQAAGALGGQAIQTGANIGGQLTNIGQAQAGAATGAAGALGNAATTAAFAPLITRLLNQGSMYGPQAAQAAYPGAPGGGYYGAGGVLQQGPGYYGVG